MQELNCVEVNAVSGGGDGVYGSILGWTPYMYSLMGINAGGSGGRGPIKESVEDSMPPENL